MKSQLVIGLIFTFASVSLLEAVTIKAPDLTRKNFGEDCKLQWMVSGTFTNYTISLSPANGNPRNQLGLNTDAKYDSVRGIITLNIWNVQLVDAGNYVLTLNTGSTPNPSSNATLFVYGYVYSSIVINPSGRTQFTDGDIIEFNCSMSSSSSMPQAFRRRLYYFWMIGSPGIGQIPLQNISTGPALTVSGDEVIGCSLKNGGQVLVINTTQILYPSNSLLCRTQEEGSSLTFPWSSTSIILLHRPFVYNFSPLSKKYSLVSPTGGSSYSFSFYMYSNPPLSSYTNWTFVDSSGNQSELLLSISSLASTNVYLSTPSTNSFGTYSASLSNSVGSTTVTFQVAQTGPPDVPFDFKVRYSSHSLVSLQWRCGWFNGDRQVVTVNLRNIAKDTAVQTLRTPIFSNPNCYNSLFTTVFQVDPNTDYEGTIWSTNVYGQSSVTSLRLKTPSKPSFSVTCGDISVTDSTAVVKVTTSAVNVWLNVSCCAEETGQCVIQSFTLLSTENQILLSQLPEGENYVFDFVLFDVFFSQTYVLSVVKGLRMSRTSGCNTTVEGSKSLLVAVIILAVLLGVAILLLSICLIVNLRMKRCHPTTTLKSSQQEPPINNAANRESQMEVDENYEGLDRNRVGDDTYYTALEKE